MAGGLMVILGAAVPFIDQPTAGPFEMLVINPDALVLSGCFGAVLAGLALAMLSRSRGPAITEVVLSSLGFCGYFAFTIAGFAGVPTDSGFGGTTMMKWDPGVGVLLSMVGCALTLLATIHVLRRSAPSSPS